MSASSLFNTNVNQKWCFTINNSQNVFCIVLVLVVCENRKALLVQCPLEQLGIERIHGHPLLFKPRGLDKIVSNRSLIINPQIIKMSRLLNQSKFDKRWIIFAEKLQKGSITNSIKKVDIIHIFFETPMFFLFPHFVYHFHQNNSFPSNFVFSSKYWWTIR